MSDESERIDPYSIVAFIFDGKKTARKRLRQIRLSGSLDEFVVEARAVVQRDEEGKVRVREPGHGAFGAVGGAALGGMLGALGGPAGILALGVIGATVGGAAGQRWGRALPIKNLESLGRYLSPDSSAFLLLVQSIEAERLIESLQGLNADVVILTIDEALSGELASYRTTQESSE